MGNATPEKPANPGVHVPPPLFYAAGFLVGYLLERVQPLPLVAADSGPAGARLAAVGLLLMVPWVLLMGGAFIRFMRVRTPLMPNRPAKALVTSGPYRITRNPMYVGMAFLYSGLALMANSWWPLIFLPGVLLIIDRFVIAREERYLRGAFPAEYAAYCGRVRRWI